MKKFVCYIMMFAVTVFGSIDCFAVNMSVEEVEMVTCETDLLSVSDASVITDAKLNVNAKAVVLMEKTTGKVLYAENEHERLYPASVTKIMSILLVCEAIESGKINLGDVVVCSENAASKGGSQIWLESGESMSVEELLKATCVYSANDACTLLGEYVAGSESAFNDLMNSRAAALGMSDTHFDNCTGLDDTTDTHLTSAYDVAVMSRELLKYDFIKEYTTIWMDSLRGGETELVNTNKLVRYYNGITGLKTGTTEKAGCCVSATAERDAMELIAVVMGSDNSKDRFASAETLLDWGFANFEIITPQPDGVPEFIKVVLGEYETVNLKYETIKPILINKGDSEKLSFEINIPQEIYAPVKSGENVGHISIKINEDIVEEYPITVSDDVDTLSFSGAMRKLLLSFS